MNSVPFDGWLRAGAMAIPILGALVLWQGRNRVMRIQHWLAGTVFCISGSLATAIFLLNRYDSCIFAFNLTNCMFDGLAVLSLFIVNGLCFRRCVRMHDKDRTEDLILMLLLSSAWAGVGLGKNLLVILVFLYLFFFVLHRWYKKIGYKGGFMKIRKDDDQD